MRPQNAKHWLNLNLQNLIQNRKNILPHNQYLISIPLDKIKSKIIIHKLYMITIPEESDT